MKVTDKYQPAQLAASSWDLYDQCSEAIGVILDNRFKDPHVTAYEHERHTSLEVFRHKNTLGANPLPEAIDRSELAKEEREIIGILRAPEKGRRLNVVGDVGVGKTTFVKHLISEHFGKGDFGHVCPIYIDFSDFTAPASDPLPEIRKKFTSTVSFALERLLGREGLLKQDLEIFESSETFSLDRQMANMYTGKARASRARSALERAVGSDAVKFTFERLNSTCRSDHNRIILVVDNIDHLGEEILRDLGRFFIEAQLDLLPMLVVAMRDHTFDGGFSAYREDGTVLVWHQRLNPPDIRRMLARRVDLFFPNTSERSGHLKVDSGGKSFRLDQTRADVCRALLNSPLQDQETYEFIRAYSNYNLRELFRNLQLIVGSPGYRGFGMDFFRDREATISVGIDECLISLAMKNHLLFFPEKSAIFNAYSAGTDIGPLDQIVAARILQLLSGRIEWMLFRDLRTTLVEWGYSPAAIEAQVRAMVRKDLVWTSTGAPSRFSEASGIRLSYRGLLYVQKILKRTVYNYMMSFDFEAPNETHPVVRHTKKDLIAELETFGDFKANVESDVIASRVLGLASLIFEVEQTEIQGHKKRSSLSTFTSMVAPKSISIGILEGLTKFLEKTHQRNGHSMRFMPPTTATLKEVGDALDTYRGRLKSVFGEK